jgi:hypothetical protein
MWGTRRPFLLLAAMVAYGCVGIVVVGHWRLTSDQPIVRIVNIVYGSNLFYSYIGTIHS